MFLSLGRRGSVDNLFRRFFLFWDAMTWAIEVKAGVLLSNTAYLGTMIKHMKGIGVGVAKNNLT